MPAKSSWVSLTSAGGSVLHRRRHHQQDLSQSRLKRLTELPPSGSSLDWKGQACPAHRAGSGTTEWSDPHSPLAIVRPGDSDAFLARAPTRPSGENRLDGGTGCGQLHKKSPAASPPRGCVIGRHTASTDAACLLCLSCDAGRSRHRPGPGPAASAASASRSPEPRSEPGRWPARRSPRSCTGRSRWRWCTGFRTACRCSP